MVCKNCKQEKEPFLRKDKKPSAFCSIRCGRLYSAVISHRPEPNARRVAKLKSLFGAITPGVLRMKELRALDSKYEEKRRASIREAHARRNAKVIADWKKGLFNASVARGYISKTITTYLINTRGDACWKCGWGKVNRYTGRTTTQWHHIDGDSRNCKEGNLIRLCPNCHSLTPTYGALNKGCGRTDRRGDKEWGEISFC